MRNTFENIVNALTMAKQKGLITLALAGRSAGSVNNSSDYIIKSSIGNHSANSENSSFEFSRQLQKSRTNLIQK